MIASELGFSSPSGAYEAVKAGLNKTLREPADDLRQLELTRLDAMLESISESVLAGDLDAISTALRISERRSRLLGLDRREAPLSIKLPKLNKATDALPVTAALLAKAAGGELLPDEAAKLSGPVTSFMKIAETAELAERVTKLEEMRNESGKTSGALFSKGKR